MKIDKIKLLTTLVIVLLVLNLTTLAGIWRMVDFKQMQFAPPPPSPKNFLIHKLKLDKEQQEVFEELRQEHFAQMNLLKEEIREEKKQLYDLLKSPVIDTTTTYTHFASIMAKENHLERITFEHFRKLRFICNDEQKQHFDVIIDRVLEMVMQGKKTPHPNHHQNQVLEPNFQSLP